MKAFLLFSHQLSQEQQQDLIQHYSVSEFVSLPKELQILFSSVPSELESLKDYLNPIKEFIKNHAIKNDVALISGDFGASFYLVNFCQDLGLKCVYATTKRESIESINEKGECIKSSVFKHVRFREYEK
ncbi:CRISPR-associated protein Csx20 [Helicobacter cetorum]|uniref:CRISPR-associated protein Csx20 n=1 Tax=Helicobacter cetorum TaxID=138563 RepID=UPI000CF12BBD|nr:CRISPR-associated protein Csx20 [Helicobacter cetorum]